MAMISAPPMEILEALRERLGQVPWVQAVFVAPEPATLHVWTMPCPPDEPSEEEIYSQEVGLIRAFPQAHFDFHFAERTQADDLQRVGAVMAFTR